MALEVPVMVNGARTVEGTDRREPFSEGTHTVLVFANGAVIRLASAVSTGQLLFLTNEKTKKEVVCQVVKSKTQPSTAGYVELEFTEAAPDFWGMRFAGSAPASPALHAARAVEASAVPLLKSLEEKLAETKTAEVEKPESAVAPQVAAKTAPAAPAPVSAAPGAASQGAPPVETPVETNLLTPTPEFPVAPATPLATASILEPPAARNGVSQLPTLSEFLMRGSNGTELRPAARPANGTKPMSVEPSKGAPTEAQSAPKNGLTAALLGSAIKSEFLSLKPAVAENAAPGSVTFDFGAPFDAEEVKVPSWLEPLARNSVSTGAAPVSPPFSTEARPSETKHRETPQPPVAKQPEATDLPAWLNAEPKSVSADASAENEKVEGVLTLSGEGPVPNFGSGLAIDKKSGPKTKAPRASGSHTGLILTLAAILLLLVAAGAWYWFTTQSTNASDGGRTPAEPYHSTFANDSVTRNENDRPDGTASGAVSPSLTPASNPAPLAAAGAPNAPNTASTNGSVRESLATRNSGNALSTVSVKPAANSAASLSPNFAAQPEALKAPDATNALIAKKPSVGNLHLAAPVVNRKKASQNAEEPEPAIDANGSAAADSSGVGLLSKTNGPAAPVGGDVKPARLVSSVAPVYPQIARNQHVGGNVVLDCLVDVNGNVSGMKVISGPALLHQAAMDALRQWKYKPATLNGDAVPMHLSITIQFKVQ